MSNINFKRTKLACYTAYFTMSSIFALPPLLFVTMRETYGISYTLLGTLVLTNFLTQLTIDLVFTFFSKYFNVHKIVKIMPLITALGLFIYAIVPTVLPQYAFWGLFVGTVIFSVSAGLSEVLLSPVIAAIPSDNPQRDMSALHSLYAFGVFAVVTVSTLFLKIFGTENWMFLVGFFALWPIVAAVMFMISPMPDMTSSQSEASGMEGTKRRAVGLALCIACIFFGSCAENAMSNWISGFVERALGVDKAIGDILGVAMFAILLGLARIGYSRFGKKIMPVLLVGMIGSAVCYLVIGICPNVIISFIACALVGLFASMLWPGSLIMMEENVPGVGVAAYAMMASSGDLGAAIAPQLIGVIVDKVSVSSFAAELAPKLSLTAEQIGMKVGMLVCALFPIVGVVVILTIMRYFKKQNKRS